MENAGGHLKAMYMNTCRAARGPDGMDGNEHMLMNLNMNMMLLSHRHARVGMC